MEEILEGAVKKDRENQGTWKEKGVPPPLLAENQGCL